MSVQKFCLKFCLKDENWPALSVFLKTVSSDWHVYTDIYIYIHIYTTALTAIVKLKRIYEQLDLISRRCPYRKR